MEEDEGANAAGALVGAAKDLYNEAVKSANLRCAFHR